MDVKKKDSNSITYLFFKKKKKNNLYGEKGVSQAFALEPFPLVANWPRSPFQGYKWISINKFTI